MDDLLAKWLLTLTPAQRAYHSEKISRWSKKDAARAEFILQVMRQRGYEGGESWAVSEVNQDAAQLARFCLLYALKRGMPSIEREAMKHRAVDSLLEKGSSAEDVRALVRETMILALQDFVCTLDAQSDNEDDAEGLPGWVLVERMYDPITEEDRPTGREVTCLHESLGFMFPDRYKDS